MASFNEINNEWSTLCQICPQCWTMDDLQLAAELGKTLLERNKDLENTLKHQQNVIEDNNQEIEYLTKQTIALKEVNDSRLRIYEQLEVNIQDLERANHRLAVDNSTDKKLIKNLTSNVELLESKCEELQSNIEDLRTQIDTLRKRPTNNTNSNFPTKFACGTKRSSNSKLIDDDELSKRDFNISHAQNEDYTCVTKSPSLRYRDKTQQTQTTPNQDTSRDVNNAMEQIEVLVAQLGESRDRYSLDQHRILELEEQLTALHDQNRSLQTRLDRNEENGAKTMHEEFTTLEEVRQGQLCQRCLRTVENGNIDCDLVSLCDVGGLEDDDRSMIDALTSAATSGITPNQQRYRTSFNIEIQEYAKKSPPQVNLYKQLIEKYEAVLELQRTAIHDEPNKFPAANPLLKDPDDESGHGDSLQPEKQPDFSEAETSSSGFADETSNKATQTSLTDPEDSRFNTNPEYKELFRDIFNTLKKDVENEPTIEPATKIIPTTNDNDQSDVRQERTLTPYVREQFEYISVAVNARKRSSNRRNKKPQAETTTHIVGSPTITYASRPSSGQRKRQPVNKGAANWSGDAVSCCGRSVASPTPSQSSGRSRAEIEFKPSKASFDLHALKKLDKSYAEVLKSADTRSGQRGAKNT